MENGISVHKTFSMHKSESTGIVLNSKSDADILKEKLTENLPHHKVEKVATKMSAITVVGLQREYSKDQLLSMIKKQNPGICSLFESSSSCPQDQVMNVLAIQPLRKQSSESVM